ncbi:GUN4 domain-containing protein [Roseofilum sp. Guam]|uniref:GUN4 domain-containing protein n=1 Tax=Roseofilum sp. Guam TaxID=2821502 RepID=UPI001B069DC4|nr:GUN4 domain-containing protein [Roseofilum sp. Guam]MBP0030788.1 GUN4 domain-containing protein [Roseofilum sp. Guam]
MVGDIIKVLSTLGEFSDKLKKADAEKREIIASYFSRVGECLSEISQQLKAGESAYSKVSELRELAQILPETIKDEMSQEQANELSNLLKASLGDNLDDLKNNEPGIRQIEECAGKFNGIAFTIKYPKKKSTSIEPTSTGPNKRIILMGIIGLVGLGVVATGFRLITHSQTSQQVDEKYQQLETYLNNQDWQSADAETMNNLLAASTNAIPNREERNWLDKNDIKMLLCDDIKTINDLWSSATNNHFGLVTQSRIWQEAGGSTNTENVDSKIRKKFSDKIGWKDAEEPNKLTLDELYRDLDKKTIEKIKRGYLPSALGRYKYNTIFVGNGNEFAALTEKLQECKIK